MSYKNFLLICLLALVVLPHQPFGEVGAGLTVCLIVATMLDLFSLERSSTDQG